MLITGGRSPPHLDNAILGAADQHQLWGGRQAECAHAAGVAGRRGNAPPRGTGTTLGRRAKQLLDNTAAAVLDNTVAGLVAAAFACRRRTRRKGTVLSLGPQGHLAPATPTTPPPKSPVLRFSPRGSLVWPRMYECWGVSRSHTRMKLLSPTSSAPPVTKTVLPGADSMQRIPWTEETGVVGETQNSA